MFEECNEPVDLAAVDAALFEVPQDLVERLEDGGGSTAKANSAAATRGMSSHHHQQQHESWLLRWALPFFLPNVRRYRQAKLAARYVPLYHRRRCQPTPANAGEHDDQDDGDGRQTQAGHFAYSWSGGLAPIGVVALVVAVAAVMWLMDDWRIFGSYAFLIILLALNAASSFTVRRWRWRLFVVGGDGGEWRRRRRRWW